MIKHNAKSKWGRKFTLLLMVTYIILTFLPSTAFSNGTCTESIPGNTPPNAEDDYATTPINTSITIDVLANDTDPNMDKLYLDSVQNASNGLAERGANDTIIYTPNEGFVGEDSFTYTISDGNCGRDTATVYITVTGDNSPPIANDDSAETPVNTPVTIDVLANDSDPDGDCLTVTEVTECKNGAVTINEDGTVDYIPAEDYVGKDNFSYTISDGNGGTAEADVIVTVKEGVPPSNNPPVANDDLAVTEENTAIDIAVLDNDSDPDGDNLTVMNVTYASHGTVGINEDGTVKYTPDNSFYGTDSFDYSINDGNGGTDTATVNVEVRHHSSGGDGGDNGGSDDSDSDDDSSGRDETNEPADEPDREGPETPDVPEPESNDPEPTKDKIDINPKRVPAGDPEITVFPGTEVSKVYAVLPEGRKLDLKEIKDGVWKVSFLVPFETPDGPYNVKVYVVDKEGNEREHIYRITIDNSLPLLKVEDQLQSDGSYSLKVKALFDARSMYYVNAETGEKTNFTENKGLWTAYIPGGEGYILAIDESGYEVKQDLALEVKSMSEEETINGAQADDDEQAETAMSNVEKQEEQQGNKLKTSYMVVALLGLVLALVFGMRNRLS